MLRTREFAWRPALWLATAVLSGCGPSVPPPPMPLPPGVPSLPILLPPGPPPAKLKPGEFIWRPEAAPAGPMVILVSLPEQRAYVYRNGVAIGVTTVSTGRPGNATPTGVFTILQRKTTHHSDLYDNSPMPFMHRLTWDGVALHAGKLPGYPASHGCVRMPYEFAKLLFAETFRGLTVVIAGGPSSPLDVQYPGLRAPLDSAGQPAPPLAGTMWDPSRAPSGPLTILVSTADRAVHVFRNGVEIGLSPVQVAPNAIRGTVVFSRLEGLENEPSRFVPGRPAMRWLALGLSEARAAATLEEIAGRIVVPPAFAANVYAEIVPGSTILLTDQPAGPATRTGPGFSVLDAGEPGR